MYKRFFLISLFLVISLKTYAQSERETSLVLDYTLNPSYDDIGFSKTTARFSYPIKLDKGFLINNVGVDYFNLSYDNMMDISTSKLENFYGLNYSLTYVRPLNFKWIVFAQAGTMASSNSLSLNGDDFVFRGGIGAMKRGGTLEKPSVLRFGLNYATFTGEPKLLPTISYMKKLNDKFSFSIGFPNTYLKYNFNKKSSLKTLLWLNGFYANIDESIPVGSNTNAEKASLRSMSAGLEYQYLITQKLLFITKVGYSFNNQYRLLDANQNEVYEFDTANEPYLSIGFKYNLKKKQQPEKVQF